MISELLLFVARSIRDETSIHLLLIVRLVYTVYAALFPSEKVQFPDLQEAVTWGSARGSLKPLTRTAWSSLSNELQAPICCLEIRITVYRLGNRNRSNVVGKPCTWYSANGLLRKGTCSRAINGDRCSDH